MNRLIILAIVVIAAIYVLISSIFVVNEREQAIVLRFGQITDVKTEPGIYFKLPTTVVDSVQIIESSDENGDFTTDFSEDEEPPIEPIESP